MKAQLYDGELFVRIFDCSDPYALMDCKISKEGRAAANVALSRCGLIRKSKWKRWPSGFYEVQVSFKR